MRGELTRVRRTTSDDQTYLAKSKTIKKAFQRRGYPSRLTEQSPSLETHHHEGEALRFKATYNPQQQPMLPALRKHWNLISDHATLREIYPTRPSVCHKVNRNISQHLVRAQTPGKTKTDETITFKASSMPKKRRVNICYTSNCPLCDNLIDIRKLGTTILTTNLTCDSSNIIYGIRCKICPNKLYIGQTTRKLKIRYAEHRNRCRKNLSGHSTPTLTGQTTISKNMP